MKTTREHIGKSKEDYLEAILVIRQEKGYCRSVDVCNHLNFTKPSVSRAVKSLEEEGYIERRDSGNIFLTEMGQAFAEKILERHVTITAIFELLGVSPETAEDDACLIEHVLSDETYDKIREWYEKNAPKK